MTTDLRRFKPKPLPAIHPVPEYAATGALAEAYARTKAGFGVPWMGVVAMAFAQYPAFYDRLWSALEPIARSAAFAKTCSELRATAEAEAGALSPLPLLARLRAQGYDLRELAEIRACNEVFSAGNMPYVLMATLARLLLEGYDWTGSTTPGATRPAPAPVPRPPLIEAHHADPTMAAIYSEIREVLGLPFVNTDYRAFARWPSYFAPAWADLRRAVVSTPYEAHVGRVHERAVFLALALPNVTGLTSADLRAAAAQDASEDEVLAVVQLFQWLLPGLALNVGVLRAQLLQTP